jgi:glycosyltransferase involved in cell wall biosynthesis
MTNTEFKKYPTISIVVAVFNGAKTLQQCLDSIIQQSYQHKELIVIDGGSADATLDLIKANQEYISYYISEPDKGIYDAWNKALKKMNGEWVTFLGADDVFLPDALHEYVDYIVAHENETFEYISSRVNLVKGNKHIRTIGNPWSWHTFRRYMNVAHVGSLHSKKLYETYGTYDINYKICADYEFLLRPKASLKAGFLNQPTVNMNIGGASDSKAALVEAERAKVMGGSRNKLIARFERNFAILRMQIRKKIWY